MSIGLCFGVCCEVFIFVLAIIIMVVLVKKKKNIKLKKAYLIFNTLCIVFGILSILTYSFLIYPDLFSYKSDPTKESQNLFLAMFATIPYAVFPLIFDETINQKNYKRKN